MTHNVSIKLNKEEYEMLRDLTKRFGTTKTNVIKSCIRRIYYFYKDKGVQEIDKLKGVDKE